MPLGSGPQSIAGSSSATKSPPVRDPNEVVVELRLTQLLRVMELPTYAVKLTADDVDDLCRRLRGQ